MASLVIKSMLGEAATPKNVAILFAVITILLVAVMMYFFSKDCGDCSFRMLKRFAMWGLGAALVGYVIGMGVQAGPSFGMGRMGAAGMMAGRMPMGMGVMQSPLIETPQFTLTQGPRVPMPSRNIAMATAPM